MLPKEDCQLLEPGSLWRVWNFLQTHTHTSVLPNPPSSGFMGKAQSGVERLGKQLSKDVIAFWVTRFSAIAVSAAMFLGGLCD